ncbi:hypothetical protein F443_01350, partial [Phytophthora nicotianae P1569]
RFRRPHILAFLFSSFCCAWRSCHRVDRRVGRSFAGSCWCMGFAERAAAGHRSDRALRELRSDHEVQRHEFLATRRRAEDLDRQLADAANAASPYVLFCQRKYEVVHHQLESTRTELVECLNALQKRLDNSRELEACRLRYRNL